MVLRAREVVETRDALAVSLTIPILRFEDSPLVRRMIFGGKQCVDFVCKITTRAVVRALLAIIKIRGVDVVNRPGVYRGQGYLFQADEG